MPQSLAKVLVHLVFSTKNREPIIPLDTMPELHAYLVSILTHLNCPALQVGGTADHIPLLFSLARTTTIADLVEETKKVLPNG